VERRFLAVFSHLTAGHLNFRLSTPKAWLNAAGPRMTSGGRRAFRVTCHRGKALVSMQIALPWSLKSEMAIDLRDHPAHAVASVQVAASCGKWLALFFRWQPLGT